MLYNLFIGKNIEKSKNVLFWTVASGIVYSLQSLVFLAVIQQVLKDETAGIYSAGFVVASQIFTIAKYCVRNYQVSDVKEKYSFDDYFSTRIFTCGIALIVSVAWVVIAGFNSQTVIVTLGLCVYKVADALSDLFEGLYQQKFRFDISGKSQCIKDVLMIIQYVVMIIVTRNLVLSTVVLAVFSVLLVVIVDIPLSRKFVRWKFGINAGNVGCILAACFALFVGSFAHQYIQQAPRYAIMGLPDTVGVPMLAKFNELFMPTYMLYLFAGFTLKIWLTKLAVYHNEGNRKGFVSILYKQSLIIVILTILSSVGMYLLGGWMLTLIYGTDLNGFQWFHVIIMIAGAFSAWYELFESVLIIYRKQTFGICASIASCGLAAIVLPFFVRHSGLMGAAVGYLVINAVRAAIYFVMAIIFMKKEKKEC